MSALLTRKLNEARDRLKRGDVTGGQALCEAVLARAPRNPDALCLLGIASLIGGRPREALPALERALDAAPQHGLALENLGLAHLMLGEFSAAERALKIAAAAPGATALAFMRLGAAILNQGRHAEAMAQFRKALELDPRNADIHINLGQAAHMAQDVSLARQHFERALQLQPGQADAMFNLGVTFLEQNQLESAQQWFEKAVKQAPAHTAAIVNLGVALQKQGQPDRAIEFFKRALQIDPNLAQARSNLADSLMLQGKPDAAREEYLKALHTQPALTEARQGLAAASLALGRFKEAAASLQAVLETEPGNVDALSALAEASLELGDLAAAENSAQRAIELDASAAVNAYAVQADIHSIRGELDRAVATFGTAYEKTGAVQMLGKLTFGLRQLCEWDKWSATWPRLAERLENSTSAVTPFSLLCEPITPEQELTNTRRWCDAQFGAFSNATSAPRLSARNSPRLKIGYISSDFYEHAVAYLVAEVLELHDRERFEVALYSYGPDDKGTMRARLQSACEHFVDIARDPDDIAAQKIRDDRLDILVDLKGHTMGARTGLLARRLCPVQVNWLGYPGTMGANFIDYIVADPFLVPPQTAHAYAERVLRMPHCYQPNDRKRVFGETLGRSEYGLPKDASVFCCFNQSYKITPVVFAVWMRLLQRVPASVLWLLEDNRFANKNLKAEAAAKGVDPDRLIFAPKLPLSQHLARYRAADLALDTFPYTSHTTASDALWGECLLVALCGETFAARVSGSVLTAGGFPELVTNSLAHYETLTLRIATDPAYREALRQKLVATRRTSPLFDSLTFTRELEKLYLGLIG